MNAPSQQHLLIFDGDCAFCRSCVAWLLRRDPDGLIAAVAWQEAADLPEQIREESKTAVQVINRNNGNRYSGGDAILFILAELGWRPRLMRLLQSSLLHWSIDPGYRFVANHRNWFSRMWNVKS